LGAKDPLRILGFAFPPTFLGQQNHRRGYYCGEDLGRGFCEISRWQEQPNVLRRISRAKNVARKNDASTGYVVEKQDPIDGVIPTQFTYHADKSLFDSHSQDF